MSEGKFQIELGDVKSYLSGSYLWWIVNYFNDTIYIFFCISKTCEFCILVADLVLLCFRDLCHPSTFLQCTERHTRHSIRSSFYLAGVPLMHCRLFETSLPSQHLFWHWLSISLNGFSISQYSLEHGIPWSAFLPSSNKPKKGPWSSLSSCYGPNIRAQRSQHSQSWLVTLWFCGVLRIIWPSSQKPPPLEGSFLSHLYFSLLYFTHHVL